MREDYLESLEKMFPKGFLIIYLPESDWSPTMTYINPKSDLGLAYYYHMIKKSIEEKPKEKKDWDKNE